MGVAGQRKAGLREFCWIGGGAPPAAYDLRLRGWRLTRCAAPGDCAAPVPLLAPWLGIDPAAWLELAGAPAALRARTVFVDVSDSEERAMLLRGGFGDAVACGAGLGELALRVARALAHSGCIPRVRPAGPAELDLILRDAMVAGRRAGLFPREFALLWRLAEDAGQPVAGDTLRRDVLDLRFRPETNALQVHISRLRRKLRIAGAGSPIETLPGGGYRLAGEPLVAAPARAIELDAYLRLREDLPEPAEDEHHEA